ncbi:MAG: hypothetical protein J5808_04760, partial [Paludibacteraceae bacterium]|nr:hypothetical protein [Paludibacteraceae bacterium]
MKKLLNLCVAMFAWLAFSIESHAAYELVWSDEFDCDYLNTSVWTYETGGGGWGNGESQYYTNRTDNASVANGVLTITAKRENYNGSNFTSARIISRNKVMCKYGKIEALIKMPAYASGVWPAFWMLGTAHGGNWPYCGEIDILEMMCKADANTGNTAINTYHWNYTGINGGYNHGEWGQSYSYGEQLGARYRIYGLEWTPNHMVGYVADADGGNKHYMADMGLQDATDGNGLAAFRDYEFYLILNIALGGTYVGQIPNNFQQCTMQVDWIRIYQDRDEYPTSTLTNNSAACGAVPTINTDYVKVFRDEALNGSVLDWSSAPFYIWENTMTAGNEAAAEGDNCLSMTVGNSGWYGAGFAYSGSALDYRNLRDYTLHFRLKTSNTNPFTLTVGDKSIQFTPTAANQWREYNIAVSQFNPTLGIDASIVPLSFNQGNNEQNMNGRTFAWDDIYFYKQGGSNVANLVVNDAVSQIKRKNGTTTMLVSGSHLNGNVTLVSSNPAFQLSKTTLIPTNGTVNETITITYTGTTTANSVITATCNGVEAQGRVFSYFSGIPQIDADYVVLMSDRDFNGSVLNWGGSDFNIWYTNYENPPQATMTVVNNVNAFEGDGCIALQVGNKGWYGSGYVVNQQLDYANLNNYKLHFAYYSSSNQPFNVNIAGSAITITPTRTNAWVEYEIPVSSLYLQLGEASSFEPFSFMQGTGENVQAGRILAFDDIYYYIEGGSGVANLSMVAPWTIDGQNGTAEFKVSGSHLTGNVTLSISNPDFVLSKTTLVPVGGLVNETVTVTYTKATAGWGTIKARCGDLEQSVKASALGTSTRTTCALTTTFGQADPYMAHTWDWTQIYDYVYSVNGNTMDVTLNHATTTTWQAQFWMVPVNKLSLTQGNTYTVRAAIVLNQAQNVTVKATQNGDADTYLINETVSVPAGGMYVFEKSAQARAGLDDVRIVFDFGGNATGLHAQVFNVEIGETSCYDALEPGDDPVIPDPEPDEENPTRPGTISAVAGETTLALTWGASTDNVAVAGYNIYVNGTKVGTSIGASYTVTGLQATTTYQIGVEAYDAAGNTSNRRNGTFTTTEHVQEPCHNTFTNITGSRNVVNEGGNWHEVNGLHTVNGTDVTVNVGNANYAALYVVLSGDDQTLDAGTTYVFEGTITATKAATVSVYLESRDNNEGQHMFDDNVMNLAANTPYNFSVEATNPQALTNPDMTISVPNGPANTTYTLTNVKIREKNCAVNIDEANVAEPTLAVIPNPAGNVA